MDYSLIVIFGAAAIFLALFVQVTLSPALTKRIFFTAAGVVAVLGLIFYGICFNSICDSPLLSVINTCHNVCLLFIGEGSTDAIEGAPLLQYVPVQILFSVLSFLGLFTTAGAAVSAIGANILRKIRIWLHRSKPLAIIYSLSPSTLEFARELLGDSRTMVIFVDDNPTESCSDTAQELGCVIRSDDNALAGNAAFLRSLGVGKHDRKLSLYALSDDPFSNRNYACDVATALQARKVSPPHTSLTIFANEDAVQDTICSQDGGYSFGSLLCISQEQMAARLLMLKSPVWETMSFDENALATEDFHALVIGSGKVGQAVIKSIVMNGQFAGSQFSLTVFDPNFDAVTGHLFHESGEMFANYHIQPYGYDARSRQMYDFLNENLHKLKYIVVCTGSDRGNKEISRQLSHFLSAHDSDLPIHICSRRGLQRITAAAKEHWNVFSAQVLCSDILDKKAMLLNHTYCGNEKTMEENWAECNYFNRMSSRASADFAPAFLKMAGLPKDAVPSGDWCTPAQLENMAITEHERWCAFHYCMGFRAMTGEEFAERCRIYAEEKAKNPASRYRIGKDMTQRIHCCLIPWEALDALSAAETAVTGKAVDYKAMDRNNVLTLPVLLQSVKE